MSSHYYVKIILVLLISVLSLNCAGDNKSDMTRPAPDHSRNVDEPQIGIGPYLLNPVLSAEAPFMYDIRIIDPASGKIMEHTQASIGASAVHYFSDADYFVLPVDPNQGEVDGSGNPVYKVFLVFDIAVLQFKRYGIMFPSADYFCVIRNKLYIGSHLEESPDAALTIIDLLSGKIRYIFRLKDGDEFKNIETWAPVVGVTDEGEVVVRLVEYDEKLYRIENGYLVFHQNGIITPPPNPLLPLQ